MIKRRKLSNIRESLYIGPAKKFSSAQKNFEEFIEKLQSFLDKQSMGLEIVGQDLGMGGAFIKIEQRDENGERLLDGLASWMDDDDAEEYYRLYDDD